MSKLRSIFAHSHFYDQFFSCFSTLNYNILNIRKQAAVINNLRIERDAVMMYLGDSMSLSATFNKMSASGQSAVIAYTVIHSVHFIHYYELL
jgi:hypothetical protein